MHITYKLLLITLFSISTSIASEVGKYDGGEYCHRLAGSTSCRMRPTAQELQEYLMRVQQDEDFANRVKSGIDASGDQPYVPYAQSRVEQMDFDRVRKQFPIFEKPVDGKKLHYFDTGASAQMPQSVCDAIVEYYLGYKSNVGRGLYTFAADATAKFEQSRSKVASFIGAQPSQIMFTAGSTAGINLVAQMWAEHNLQAGDEIIISQVEHNANFIPWFQLAARKGLVLTRAPLCDAGTLDLDVLSQLISEKTKLIAITHQSNILGTVNNIAAIVEIARTVGAKVMVDAAQSIAHQRVNVTELGCDFLVFSGHKLFGPTGVGVLYIAPDMKEQCVIHNFGGGSVYEVTVDEIEFKSLPYGAEPGTQAIAQVIGLGAAIDFVLENINFEQAAEHETKLVRRLLDGLKDVRGIKILSHIPQQDEHSSMVTFMCNQDHAYDVAEALSDYGIAVRAGYHCCQPYHDMYGGHASLRVSFSVYNSEAEVDFLIECLQKILA